MTEDERFPGDDSCSADVGAYALGALVPEEADRFELHLRGCTICASELRAFQAVVDEIAISAPLVPVPSELRRRVLSEVKDEARSTAARTERPRRRRSISLGGPLVALGAGVAFAVAAIVVVVLALPGKQGNRTVDALVTGRGTAALRISANQTDLVVHHLAAPPAGEIYEVWLEHGSKGRPQPTTALFGVNRDGDTSVEVPGSMYGVSHVLVTPEPAGGTRTPTHKPVITVTL